jgi:hypothetical protein
VRAQVFQPAAAVCSMNVITVSGRFGSKYSGAERLGKSVSNSLHLCTPKVVGK